MAVRMRRKVASDKSTRGNRRVGKAATFHIVRLIEGGCSLTGDGARLVGRTPRGSTVTSIGVCVCFSAATTELATSSLGASMCDSLRAKIDETVLPVVITEQGEKRNQP